MKSFIFQYANELASIWLLGVMIFGIRWGGSMYYTHQLRNIDTLEVPEYWHHQVQLLADKLGIYQSIRLLESAKAEVPMVIRTYETSDIAPHWNPCWHDTPTSRCSSPPMSWLTSGGMIS